MGIAPNDLVDQQALHRMLVASLEHYRDEIGEAPASTSILFEPHHECWGIYHSSRVMHEHDSPGDYDVHNSGTGEIHASAASLSRDELVDALSSLGGSLVSGIDAALKPSRLSLSLDYDEVWCCPERESDTGGVRDHQNPKS